MFRDALILNVFGVQSDVDRRESVHGPARVGLRAGEQPPHEAAHKLGEALLDDALPHRTHQSELHRVDTAWSLHTPFKSNRLHNLLYEEYA